MFTRRQSLIMAEYLRQQLTGVVARDDPMQWLL